MEVRYPPQKKGISAILARYHMKTRQMGAIFPSAILSRKGIVRYGGVSLIGPPSSELLKSCTVGTKIIADPEKCFQELMSEKILIYFFAGWALSGIDYRFQ